MGSLLDKFLFELVDSLFQLLDLVLEPFDVIGPFNHGPAGYSHQIGYEMFLPISIEHRQIAVLPLVLGEPSFVPCADTSRGNRPG